VVLQRRCVRASRDLLAGSVLSRSDVVALRPAPREAFPAHHIDRVIGRKLNADVVAGQDIRPEHLE